MFQLLHFGHGVRGVFMQVALYSPNKEINLQPQSLQVKVPIPLIISLYFRLPVSPFGSAFF